MDDNKEFELEHDHIDEEEIVVITDEDGNEMYFREEMVIPVGEKSLRFFPLWTLTTAAAKMKNAIAMMKKTMTRTM